MGKTEIGDYRIVVVGPGALGCLLAGYLGMSGQEVWLLDKRPERARRIRDGGIRIEGTSGEHKAGVPATADAGEIGESHLVIICVKSYDTAAAAEVIPDLIGQDTLVLTLQNGVGNLEELARRVEPEKLAGGVTSHGATLLGPGHIRHAGRGETVVGPYRSKNQKSKIKNQKLEEIVKIFNKAGLPTRVGEDAQDLIWSKLVINAGINALSAVTRLNNGRLLESAASRKLLRLAVEEAAAVAGRRGIKLIFDNPVAKAESVCRATSGNVASMLQDVLKRRRTEIDYINGAILREGERLKIPTPVNRVLTELVKTIEESYEKRVEKI